MVLDQEGDDDSEGDAQDAHHSEPPPTSTIIHGTKVKVPIGLHGDHRHHMVQLYRGALIRDATNGHINDIEGGGVNLEREGTRE